MAEIFICPKFHSLAFYVNDKRYQFYGGVFDMNEYPETEHEAIKKSLAKTDPASGVMVQEEYGLPFKCDWGCERKFASQAAKNGHKAAHRTKEDIETLSWREGGAPPKDS